jgi:hypothetical protein
MHVQDENTCFLLFDIAFMMRNPDGREVSPAHDGALPSEAAAAAAWDQLRFLAKLHGREDLVVMEAMYESRRLRLEAYVQVLKKAIVQQRVTLRARAEAAAQLQFALLHQSEAIRSLEAQLELARRDASPLDASTAAQLELLAARSIRRSIRRSISSTTWRRWRRPPRRRQRWESCRTSWRSSRISFRTPNQRTSS